MSLDVVVVNYRTTELLNKFVKSYEDHKFAGCELFVVDVDPLEVWEPTADCTYLPLTSNTGYGYACNLGASKGSNDVILLANSDTELSDGLSECRDALLSNDGWGCLGPRQVNHQGRISYAGTMGTPTGSFDRGWQETDQGQYQDVVENCPYVQGSLFFVKRPVWETLTDCPIWHDHSGGAQGAFLESPHYYEETWCCYHMRHHGWDSVYYGLVTMTHRWHESSPLGGWADDQVSWSREVYRAACRAHNITSE